MDRSYFHKLFKTIGPAVLPVIHVLDERQAIRNIKIAMLEGAQGVFLINHDFSHEKLLPILVKVRDTYPSLWIGVNFLGVNVKGAFKVLSSLSQQGCLIDAYWADNAGIDERVSLKEQVTADAIATARKASGWDGLYFGGTAFKYQRHVDDNVLGRAAEYASNFMDVVTTSGSGTGVAATLKRITDMRDGIKEKALALASGVNPQNASSYAPFVDCFLVATGISTDFHNLNPLLVRALIRKARGDPINVIRPIGENERGWYLSLMGSVSNAPSLDTETILDPTCIYTNKSAFSDLIDDMVKPIERDIPSVDMIVGIEGGGAPLAAGVALKLGVGLLTLSKADISGGDGAVRSCYQKFNALQAGVNAIVVDACIDDVVVVKGAIELIERQDGTVVAVTTICSKTNPQTTELYQKYYAFDVVPFSLKEKYDHPKIKFSYP